MVSQIVKEESTYQKAFRELQGAKLDPRALWIGRLRESAMDRFDLLGFPSVTEEEWKYTNVAPMTKVGFQPLMTGETPSTLGLKEIEPFAYGEAEQARVVFVNGLLRKDLCSLNGLSNIVLLELSEALKDDKYSEVVREYLARIANYNDNAFTALNTAFVSNGVFVLVPKGVHLEAPLHLLFLSDPVRPNIATFPRALIVAEENSAATIIESYAAVKDAVYFTNTVVEIVLKDGAQLSHYKVQRESVGAFHVATTQANPGPNSSYDTTTITLGAQLSRHNMGVTLDQEGAECWVDGLYTVGSGQHADTHSVIDHRGPRCTSHQLYKGILDGKSRAVFNGKIFVRPGAQQTDAMQTNKNLLLSNEAHVDTKPQLEIFADDVKCAHGAAVGQLDQDQLFYVETRGIDPRLARKLLTYGFAEEVIGKIKVESIRAQLDEWVMDRLNARLET
jgi:Fe-S cluster assembly protein SufD